MYPIVEYKFVGLLAVAILAFGLAFLVFRWPLGIHKTFSQHAAARNVLIVYYFVLFSIVLSLLAIFFVTWFAPTFKLPGLFITLVLASSVCQILCTVIPETKGWKVYWHRLLAGLSAVILLPSLVVLLYTHTIQLSGKVSVVTGLLVMCGVITTILMRGSRTTYHLLLQAAYFIAYFVPIIYISYMM